MWPLKSYPNDLVPNSEFRGLGSFAPIVATATEWNLTRFQLLLHGATVWESEVVSVCRVHEHRVAEPMKHCNQLVIYGFRIECVPGDGRHVHRACDVRIRNDRPILFCFRFFLRFVRFVHLQVARLQFVVCMRFCSLRHFHYREMRFGKKGIQKVFRWNAFTLLWLWLGVGVTESRTLPIHGKHETCVRFTSFRARASPSAFIQSQRLIDRHSQANQHFRAAVKTIDRTIENQLGTAQHRTTAKQ